MSDEYSYEFERGDVFTGDSGTIKVEGVSRFGDYLTVSDPTVDHPQDARAGTWTVERGLLEQDLDEGTVERASLEVNT